MLISEVPTFGRCFKNDCDFGKEILIKKNYNYQFLEKNIKVDQFIAKLISEKNVNNQSAGSNVEIESDINYVENNEFIAVGDVKIYMKNGTIKTDKLVYDSEKANKII